MDDPLERTRQLCDLLEGTNDTGEPDREAVQPGYAGLDTWINDWLSQVVELKTTGEDGAGGAHWCPRWHEHPTAVQRLAAAWREWEKARASDSMSRWWCQEWDAHLAALTDEHGPFARCLTRHTAATPIPIAGPDPRQEPRG